MKSGLMRSVLAAGLCLSILPLAAGPSIAAGESTLIVPKPKTTKTSKKKCKTGRVYSTRLKKCVRKSSSLQSDEDKYWQGARLAKAGQYQDAIRILSTVDAKNDPRVLNYLGYANRKLGRFDIGLSYYYQALAIDPDYTLARSYLGEAYIHLGKLDLAKEQLEEIAQRAGKDVREYRLLDQFISNAG